MFNNIMEIIMNNDYLSFEKKKRIFNDLHIDINEYIKYNTFEYLMDKKEFDAIYNYQNKKENNINELKFENSFDYKISIIIYCTEFKSLNKTIYSIENQINSNDNEIIIVYDRYNNKANINNKMNKTIDINFKYIQYIKRKFKNIKIIDNQKKKGILYSYSIGILNSIGEYILLLQPGFTLTKDNILSTLYEIAKTGKIDFLEFNLLINKNENINFNSFEIYKGTHFKSNKDLEIIKVNKEYNNIIDYNDILFNKLVKANIYKKIIYKNDLAKYNIPIYNYYENILLFLINKYKLNFKHVDEYGVIKNKHDAEFEQLYNITKDKKNIIKDSLFYINFLFDNSDNSISEKTKVLQEFINILSIIYNKFEKLTDDSKKLIEKFNKCRFINEEDKTELLLLINSLIN